MACHLPPMQPLWSFASPVNRPDMRAESTAPVVESAPVLGWSAGPDGRPRPRWAVGRSAPPRV